MCFEVKVPFQCHLEKIHILYLYLLHPNFLLVLASIFILLVCSLWSFPRIRRGHPATTRNLYTLLKTEYILKHPL